MAAKYWNPTALEESLAKLYEAEHGSLHGRHGEVAVACRKLGEMRVIWLCFEEYEGLPHGVGRASRTDALAFLGWVRRSPELRLRGPSRDQALSVAQLETWAFAMQGTALAPTLRDVWARNDGLVWKRRRDGV